MRRLDQTNATRRIVLGLLLAAGCAPAGNTPQSGSTSPDPIKINEIPTGSISTPSLCERPAVDTRVTSTGVDSFAFVWADDHYQVVYSDLGQHGLYAMQLGEDGVPLAPPNQIAQPAGNVTLPSLIQTSAGYAVAWQELGTVGGASQGMVHAQALTSAGQPIGTSQLVAMGQPNQMRPVLSNSPAGITIAWMNQSPTDTEGLTTVGASTTSIALLDDNMAPRADVPAQQVGASTHAGYPWLAGDKTRLALLWSEDGGGRTDPYFSPLTQTLSMPAHIDVRDLDGVNSALLGRLALTDFGYLAAWEDNRSGESEVYMGVLDTNGKESAEGLVEEPDTGNANWPNSVWTGSAAAIVYYQYRNGAPQVFMTFVGADGKRVGGGADAQVSNTTAAAKFPDIVWTGSQFGAAWVDTRDGEAELYFNRTLCKYPAPI